jgi:hypothetical protein
MSVEALGKTRLDATSALEIAKKYNFDAMFIMGLNSETGEMALLCGGDKLNYGLLYWLAVEAQNQIHDTPFSED